MMELEQRFRDAIRENNQRIYGVCSYFFDDRSDRDDAYQESLIRIWQNLRSFRGNSLLSTWIYRVVVNTCLMHIRNDKRRKDLIGNGLTTETGMVADHPADDDPGHQDRKIAFIHQFISTLVTADKTLVSLYLEDFTTREMAEITGMSEVNVRVRLHRIREKIKNEWEEQQDGTG